MNIIEMLRRAHGKWRHTNLLKDPWRNGNYVSSDDAVFVCGCGRSGTTLLREILNRHTRIASGPELSVLTHSVSTQEIAAYWDMPKFEVKRLLATSGSDVQFVEEFFRLCAAKAGKERWLNKTPSNVRVLSKILWSFPNSKVIHIVRDGRDVACSLRHHPKNKVVAGRIVPWVHTNSFTDCVARWKVDTSCGLAYHCHPRCMQVKYEELTTEPNRVVEEICTFLDVSFEEEMISRSTRGVAIPNAAGRLVNNPDASDEVHSSSIGRWKRDMSPDEQYIFAQTAGELLLALGYVSDHGWVAGSS